MPNTILSSPYSQPSFSLVKINQSVQTNAASNWKVSKVSIRYTATTMKHQREDGTTLVDARVVLPTQVDVSIIASTIDDLEGINEILKDRESAYTVVSKGLVFLNMMMDNEQIKQNADMLSASPVRLSFKEILVQNVQPIVCRQAADSSLQDKGLQLLNQADITVSTVARNITNFIKSAIPAGVFLNYTRVEVLESA